VIPQVILDEHPLRFVVRWTLNIRPRQRSFFCHEEAAQFLDSLCDRAEVEGSKGFKVFRTVFTDDLPSNIRGVVIPNARRGFTPHRFEVSRVQGRRRSRYTLRTYDEAVDFRLFLEQKTKVDPEFHVERYIAYRMS
jgi:hypothetical protein